MNTEALFLQLEDLKKMKIPQEGRGYIELELLSKRKSELERCELCENVSHLVCEKCKVTYYCSIEHFLLDKRFHACLCDKIRSVKQPMEFHSSSETRDRWRKQRRIHMEELFLYTLKKGKTDIEKGDYDSAIPSATVSTNYATLLYGQSEEMIPPLLIAAESHLKKDKIQAAEGFLAKALSIEVTKPIVRPSVKARIRHIEGLISLARKDLEDAVESFSEAIYQNTKEFGTDHIKTSENYCHLGEVFQLTEKFEISCSLFRQTVSIWIAFLEPIYREMKDESALPIFAKVLPDEKVYMDDCDRFMSENILMRCYKHQSDCFRRKTNKYVIGLDLAHTCYALGIVFYLYDRFAEMESRATEAMLRLEQSQRHDHPLLKKLQDLMKKSNRKSCQASRRNSSSMDDSSGRERSSLIRT